MFNTKKKTRLLVSFFLALLFLLNSAASHAEVKLFRTKYVDIFYPDDKTLSDFFWKITGKRFDFSTDAAIPKLRLDGIVDRVEAILDMEPFNFHFRIDLYPEYKEGLVAKYDHKKKTITVYADRVTDGIFAHEVAHAVMCSYFPEPPPEKVQEVLAQYVDKHLYIDY